MKKIDSDFYQSFLSIGKRIKGPTGLRVNMALAAMQHEQLEGELQGDLPVVWSSPLVPSEIMYSFGISSVTPETVAAFLTAAGKGGTLLQAATSTLAAENCCSFQRVAIAALQEELVPVPLAFIAASAICDDNPKMSDFLSQHYDRKYFLLDIPATSDQAALTYMIEQLRELVRFLEELTGKTFSPERLSEAVAESNRTRDHWLAANLLRRQCPPVIYGVAPLRMAGGLLLQKLGSPVLTNAMADYVTEITERIDKADFIPCRHRLLWLHLFPLFDGKFMPYIEKELGMVVVFEESSHVWWDAINPQDPLPGLARRMLNAPLGGTAKRRLDAIKKLLNDYQVDAVINFSHIGCKSLTGSATFVGRAMREANIPFLDLNGDCLDNRSPATAQWRSRLEAFSEMLG